METAAIEAGSFIINKPFDGNLSNRKTLDGCWGWAGEVMSVYDANQGQNRQTPD